MGKKPDFLGEFSPQLGVEISETPEASWDQQKQTQNLLAGMFPQPRGSRLSPEERGKANMEKETFLSRVC